MLSLFRKYNSDYVGDISAAEAGLVYRRVDELKGLAVRSRSAHMFAWGMAAFALVLAVLHGMGSAAALRDHASVAGVGGFASVGFYALAALGTITRQRWGRHLCILISGYCLIQAGWYFSNPGHWNWTGSSMFALGQFVVAWIGLVTFIGTHELYGARRIGHGVLLEALEQAREEARRDEVLANRQLEGLRYANEQARASSQRPAA